MIRADDRVSTVLARDEGLVEVFTSLSPSFELLRKPALRRTMARMVTVAQAAKIGGVDAEVLLERLNAAIDPQAAPPAPPPPSAVAQAAALPPMLEGLPPERIADLDVRADLRAGREPLRPILDAVRALGPDQIFRLRATFEPVPLYAVLGKQGFSHHTEPLGPEDWRIWFYRDPNGLGAATNPAAREAASPEFDDEIVVLDVRALEPPEPMVQTLEALAALPRGKTLLQINERVPQFLLPKLEERGFRYEIREQSETLVRIFIRHNH